jgi:hypothetical protein
MAILMETRTGAITSRSKDGIIRYDHLVAPTGELRLIHISTKTAGKVSSPMAVAHAKRLVMSSICRSSASPSQPGEVM